MKKTLEMTFRNESGKESVLTMPDPKDDLVYHLKKIGLIVLRGRGRGASWSLERGGSNKPE